MTRHRHASVRGKLIVVMTVVVAVLSIIVYVYFPSKLRREALRAVGAKAESIAAMTAYSVTPALVFDDHRSALEAFEGARRNADLDYVAVYDEAGGLFAAYPANAGSWLPPSRTGNRERYETSTIIRHDGRSIGRLYLGLSLKTVNEQIAQTRRTVGTVALSLFAFGALAVLIVSSLITRPLGRIVETVEQIAAGHTSRRADVDSNDEIGHLAKSFNAMVDQLESLQHGLEARVDERTRELSASERRYRLLFERNLAGVYRSRIDGEVLDCNDACARIFGFESREDFLQSHASDFFFEPEHRHELMTRLRTERSIPNLELKVRRNDGSAAWVLESMNLLDGEDVIEGTVIDITARKAAEQQIEHQAYHDALTGLPNRSLFIDRLEIALARGRRKQTILAVLFIDLDRFKYVNDTFGHSAGDILLQQVATRLRSAVREEDTIARLGGDEFTLLLSDLGGASDAAKVAQKIIQVMSEPFHLQENEFYVTPSIGIALFPTDGRDVETLLKNADNAMYRSKEAGPNSYHIYSEAVNKRATTRLSLETSLRRAVEREEFVVFYQPQVNVVTSELIGVEALVRWAHPIRGILGPDEFIGLAEETKLILRIDQWVLREACSVAAGWQRAGYTVPRLAVNVSATQLHNRSFPDVIESALTESGFDPKRLELEITESTAMRTGEETLNVLRRLRGHGIRVAIDDFGMGHSALHYLHRFPVDTIKIDKTFVATLDGDTRSGAIISAIIAMARALELNVVAEGVEKAEQLAILRQLGCAEVQGYLFSKPVPAPQLLKIARGRAHAAPPRERWDSA